MALKVCFHPEAADEFVVASQWYRERSERAARAFMIEFDHALARVEGGATSLSNI